MPVFAYFGIPPKYQHRILFYGILGALVFRAMFFAMGAWRMQYRLVVTIFGAFLILTGCRTLRGPEQEVDPEQKPLIARSAAGYR